ncbi:GNAT family N-acetyltransferase, partial [Pseudomonas syringae]|nr:GNAT family N-acetyltransferase [Pseudomonas syringae]
MNGSTLSFDEATSKDFKGNVLLANSDIELALVKAVWQEVYSEELGWLDGDDT